MLSNELRDQQEGKATRWAAFFDFQRAVAPCLNGCLFPTALISSCLNCRSLGGAEICLVSKRMFIPDGTPVLVTEYYILTRRNIETLNMVVCSATSVEFCLCLKARRVWQKPIVFVGPRKTQFADMVGKISGNYVCSTAEEVENAFMDILATRVKKTSTETNIKDYARSSQNERWWRLLNGNK